MTALNFPDSPTANQVFNNWMWDGTKWVPATGAGGGIPTGTVMLFYQASAPTGWTQLTTQNDKLLRVVSGSGGVAGGSNPFSTVNAQTTVGNHSLATGEIPNITSGAYNTITVYPAGNSGLYVPDYSGGWGFTLAGGGGAFYAANTGAGTGSYTNSFSYSNYISVSTGSGGSAHNHPITMNIAYCDLIVCSKN